MLIDASRICADCPNPLPERTGPGAKKLLCDDCARKRRIQSDLRGYYERQGRVADFSAGSTVTCQTCPATFVKTRSDHLYCNVCIKQRTLECGRRTRDARRRAAGVPLRSGVEVACAKCGRLFVRLAHNGKYCGGCPNAKSVICNGRRRKTDPAFKLTIDFGAAIRKSLIRGKNGAKWESVVGYTFQDLMRHLERQFTGKMSWENRGKWHIDHIIALDSFTFSTVDDPEFRAAWALSNLRPLWKRPNLLKGNKRHFLI